jgi:hypothetical protein
MARKAPSSIDLESANWQATCEEKTATHKTLLTLGATMIIGSNYDSNQAITHKAPSPWRQATPLSIKLFT